MAILLASAACKSTPSQTSLSITADADAALGLEGVAMAVSAVGKPTVTQELELSNPTWTIVFPTASSALKVDVLVSGMKGGKSLVTARATVTVATGQNTKIRLPLTLSCADVTCAPTLTCRGGMCVAIPELPATSVDAAVDTATPNDADAGDGGGLTDRGFDMADGGSSVDATDAADTTDRDSPPATDADASPDIAADTRVDSPETDALPPRCGDGIVQPGEQCESGTRQQMCGRCNRGTRTDTCSMCQWTMGACNDPDADLGAITNAFQQSIAETSEANWGFGGPCSPNNVRESYVVVKQAGEGSCEALYSNWAKLGDAATPVRSDTLGPTAVADVKYCGVVLGVFGPATCQVTIKQKRVCPP